MKKFLSVMALGLSCTLGVATPSFAEPQDYKFSSFSFDELKATTSKGEAFSTENLDTTVDLKAANFSLKPYMHEIDSTWTQGACSSVGVFAGTLASEIRYSVYKNSPQRFSVQHFMSSYCNGGHNAYPESLSCGFACLGGIVEDFVDFYNESERFIPWSNQGASDYVDINGGCATGNGYNTYKASCRSPQDIEKHPAVKFSNMIPVYLPAFLNTTSDTKNYFKYVLLNKYPIITRIVFPHEDDIKTFIKYWENENESELFDFSYLNGKVISKGDAFDIPTQTMVIIGFNDTDPNPENHYWIVQNSWGVRSNRPNGIFRMKMNQNYQTWFKVSGENFKLPVMDFGYLAIDFETPLSVIHGNIKVDGKYPAKDVAVSVNGNRATLTDMSGRYSYRGIEKYSLANVSFKKQGYILNPSEVTLHVMSNSVKQDVEATLDPAYKDCSKKNTPMDNIVNNLVELEKIQAQIHEKTIEIANKKKDQKKKEKILSKVNTNNEKMKSYLEKIMDSFRDIPREIYNCKGVKDCSAVSHKTALRTARKQVPNILKLIQSDGDYLVENNARKQNFVNKKLAKAEQYADDASHLFSIIPGNNYFCENDQ